MLNSNIIKHLQQQTHWKSQQQLQQKEQQLIERQLKSLQEKAQQLDVERNQLLNKTVIVVDGDSHYWQQQQQQLQQTSQQLVQNIEEQQVLAAEYVGKNAALKANIDNLEHSIDDLTVAMQQSQNWQQAFIQQFPNTKSNPTAC